MAYVDMTEAVEVVKKHSISCIKSEKMSTDEITRFNAVFASIITSLRKLPTADVVEVVRCEKCQSCEIRYPAKAIGEEATEGYYCNIHRGYRKSDDFCSYGERRDT